MSIYAGLMSDRLASPLLTNALAILRRKDQAALHFQRSHPPLTRKPSHPTHTLNHTVLKR